MAERDKKLLIVVGVVVVVAVVVFVVRGLGGDSGVATVGDFTPRDTAQAPADDSAGDQEQPRETRRPRRGERSRGAGDRLADADEDAADEIAAGPEDEPADAGVSVDKPRRRGSRARGSGTGRSRGRDRDTGDEEAEEEEEDRRVGGATGAIDV